MACTTCGPSVLAQTGYAQTADLSPTGASLDLASGTDLGGSFSFSLPWLLVILFVAMYFGRKVL
ncbi:MAG TPA: hypothetical protein VFL93_07120 [Longimicrobiaceae bacterium]|nr:hypothetical protein [Longimicrobiaceae bacterium]